MFSLIEQGKVVGTAATFKEACELAKIESAKPGNVTRTKNGITKNGHSMAIWSGPISPRFPGGKYLCGVTCHVLYCCGEIG